MQLTLHADYSLRVLLYLTGHRDRPVSTQEISEAYGISRTHLVRVVQTLNGHGFVKASTGRNGGVTLTRDPAEINLGDVVRTAEPGFKVVECFDLATNTCPIARVCKMKGVLKEALDSFFEVLDRYTLADLSEGKDAARLSKYLPVSAIGRAEPNRR